MNHNHCGQNLQGRSFKGKTLNGANFEGADIRGANFTHAILIGANFTNVRAGLNPIWFATLLVGTLLGAALSGFILFYAGWIPLAIMTNPDRIPMPLGFIAVIFTLIVLIIGGIIVIRKGVGASLGIFSIVTGAIVIFLIAVTKNRDIAGLAALGALVMIGTIVGVISGAISIALIKITAESKIVTILTGTTLLIGNFCGLLLAHFGFETKFEIVTGAFMLGVPLGLLSIFIGWIAAAGNFKYQLVKTVAVNLATIGGTSFRGANLTDANFRKAILKNVDFRKLHLKHTLIHRTCWFDVQQLESARVEGTYLELDNVRELVVSQNGQAQNFDHQDLRGLFLQDSNLADASFIGTDLSGTNLSGADLSRAKLTRAQLYGANLAGAQLTGAYIENWGISPDTNLNDIQCDYIYMHLPTEQDPDPYRKPDNRQETFQPGEFAAFIAPIIRTLDSYKQQQLSTNIPSIPPKTLDLFHREGFDPNAAAIALRQLIEQNPEAHIEILSIEGPGQRNIRIQARISNTADSDRLNRNYFQNYNQIKTLAYTDLQQLLASFEAKDIKFRSLQNMVMSALRSNKFYIETTPDNTLPPTTILILAANPRGTTHVRLDEEVREIQRDIERGKLRDRFVLQQRWAVQTRDIHRALLDYEPQILHFSGHGTGTETPETSSQTHRDLSPSPESTQETEGLIFEDETGQPKLVSSEALSNLFQLFADRIECVVLNACYSEEQARAISQHIPYVIGMKRAIGDRAAIEFAIGFYDGILAGKSIEFSYKLACSAIETAGIPEHLTPVLKRKEA